MNWKRLIATGFGMGFLPIGPGSWGTLPGMGLYLLLCPWNIQIYIFFILVGLIFGVHLAGEVEKMFGVKDPKAIVIDEIIAFPVTMFLIPMTLPTLILGFFLNRLMDTVKIWPCHSLEKLPRGWGIMMDDFAAGIQSCLLMHLAVWLFPQLIS